MRSELDPLLDLEKCMSRLVIVAKDLTQATTQPCKNPFGLRVCYNAVCVNETAFHKGLKASGYVRKRRIQSWPR
jgi:hypothetical protein